MKNQKGITMVSLSLYIISFVIIIGIIGSITVFFNNNTREYNMSSGASSEYNKFNLYMLEYTKNGYEISNYSSTDDDNQYVSFSKDGELDATFKKIGDILYYNSIKLCENVDEFKIEYTTAENGKKVLKTYLEISKVVYTTDYVME